MEEAMMIEEPRSREQRMKDTLHRLENDVDCWVATTAGESAYLVPLSFLWDGSTLLLSTPESSPTGRNLRARATARIGLGPTRDVVLIDGTVQVVRMADLPKETGDAFAVKTGFDPRDLGTPYVYFRIAPQRIQAWREANELAERDLMRKGRWVNSALGVPVPQEEPATQQADSGPCGQH
ncbi:pyridoxamine 5'-phosphate oxidase family protein [Nonomuraea sp. NPDC050536]|uniref:pyridoxamine 5'-phosphate oxidase family protein n=1 Tax=Nonomuraea sp. NPDC050536 TaxID=3364366 RepID=UPI0037C8BE7C